MKPPSHRKATFSNGRYRNLHPCLRDELHSALQRTRIATCLGNWCFPFRGRHLLVGMASFVSLFWGLRSSLGVLTERPAGFNSFFYAPLQPPTVRHSVQEMPSCVDPVRNVSDDRDPGGRKWRALTASVEAFNSLDADYWITGGTLLGLVRECRLFDYDLDFVISLESLNNLDGGKRLLSVFLSDFGFELYQTLTGIDGTAASLGGEYKFLLDDVHVDVFVGVKSDSYYTTGLTTNLLLACPKPCEGVQDFYWGNLTVRVPMPYHDVLLSNYGDDYMVPRGEGFERKVKHALETGRCTVVLDNSRHTSITGNQIADREDKSGVLACLTDRSSVMHALALAESMSQWDHPSMLEFYHSGRVGQFLRDQLEAYKFVRVVELGLRGLDREDLSRCHRYAIRITKLEHVLLVRPSIIFFQNPRYWLQTIRIIQEKIRCGVGATYVTSTDMEMTEAWTKNIARGRKACILRTAYNYSTPSIVTSRSRISQHVASVHEVSHGIGAWAYPSTHSLLWIRHHIGSGRASFALNATKGRGTASLPQEYFDALQAYWYRLLTGARLMVMDRPMKWVAFDGGLETGALNTIRAANDSRQLGASILNIDLALTEDRELVALHNDETFTSFAFVGNNLRKPISKLNKSEALQLVTPCIPESIMETLDRSRYQATLQPCLEDTLDLAIDFIQEFSEMDLIFDLKASTEELQIEQARILVQLLNERARTRDRTKPFAPVSIRFFSEKNEGLVATVLPVQALKSLSSDPTIKQLSYYVNVPSALACSQMTSWIKSNESFLNKNIAGCFVVLNHKRMEESWNEFAKTNGVSLDKHHSNHDVNVICDVPRKHMDEKSLRDGFRLCFSGGFEMVHYPFQVSPKRTFEGQLQMLEAIPTFPTVAFDSVQSQLSDTMQDDEVWKEYTAQWGYTSPSEWSSREEWWFQGNKTLEAPNVPANGEAGIFRCVTKPFVVILLLRLEELGMLSLDDRVGGQQDAMPNTTLRNIITNTESSTDQAFKYDNAPWEHVPDSVHSATGMHFLDAMHHYVLDPMGAVGSFDTNTSVPPYAGRGFVGPLDDMLLLGSTLAGGGVSPKTQREVLSAALVERLLQDSTMGVKDSFFKDEVAQSMERFDYPDSDVDFPHGVVDGYGMGLWRVNGWRRGVGHGAPIRGWLSRGSSESLLYFDTSGLVVGMLATKRVMRYELTSTFARVVRDIGDHLVKSIMEEAEITILRQESM